MTEIKMEWEKILSVECLSQKELAMVIDAIIQKLGPNLYRREWHDGGIDFAIQSVNPGNTP